ncbi:MAG: LytR C-terminal domain-containing protein [Candidatus Kryptoniota bacterium]
MKRHKEKLFVRAKRYLAVPSQIVILLFAVVLAYSLLDRFIIHPPVKSERTEKEAPTKTEKLIQVSVRNECGAKNIAMDFTFYLRKRGFDVVETTNGSMLDRQFTTVVDAAGNFQNAIRVAEALGVKKQNVTTRLDPKSYVDVEVLIGKDYQNLKPNESIE